ncbi:MAG: CPBP family intramembrane glutamic endopeptidase [Anaerolineales bacterium]
MSSSEFEHKHLLKLADRQKDNHLYWVMLGWTAPTPQAALSFFKKAWELKPGDAVILDGIQWAVEEILKKTVHLDPSEVTGFLQGLDAGLVFKPEDALAQTMPLSVEEMITQALPMPVQQFIEETRLMEAEAEEPHSGWIIALAYLAGITLAEALTTVLFSPVVGLVMHGVIMIALLIQGSLFSKPPTRRMLFSLSLVPLIRLMSLSVPLTPFELVYWYLIIGMPLLLSAYVTMRLIGFDFAKIGLVNNNLPFQLLIGLTGVGLGYLEYLILRPAPLIESLTFESLWLPVIILTVYTGLLEEVIFRGLLQTTAVARLGNHAIIYVSLIFAVMHLGYQSILDFVFVFVVALLFGWIVYRQKSIVGVTIAHSLTNIFLFLVFPFFH